MASETYQQLEASRPRAYGGGVRLLPPLIVKVLEPGLGRGAVLAAAVYR
ncbi:hypothetical protein [Streptomyces sp. NPDC001815]